MPSKPDDLLPNAKDFMKRLAVSEAEEAEKAARQQGKAEAEKRKLLKQLERPSGVSDEDRIKRALAIIERAVRNGKTEVQLIRFPIDLCSDHGRAINQGERGWESTLQGLPKNSMTPGPNISSREDINCGPKSSILPETGQAMSV